MTCGETWQTSLHARIRPMELGPRLLQKTDPEFTITTCGEDRFAIGFDWQVIVDNHWRFLAVLEKVHQVDASRVDFLRNKHGFDTIGKLCQRAQRRQEVAVT